MLKQITLSLPENIYYQVQRAAMSSQRNIADVLVDTISSKFTPYPIHPNRAAMKKEIAAYQAMHTKLVEQYLGEYVALYQGEVVAHNVDPVALHRHVTEIYPEKVVLCRQVQKDAEPVLNMRSPRLESLP